MARRLDTKEFIKRATNIHGERYDYSGVSYYCKNTKVVIICDIHGPFTQTPHSHYSSGCPHCGLLARAKKRTHTTEKFITKATSIHGNRYSYKYVNYINNHTPIEIYCREHGKFLQIPSGHLSGHNCPKCVLELRRNNIKQFHASVEPTRETILYYFKHTPSNTYKLGVTSVGYDKRYSRKLRDNQELLWFSDIMTREDAEGLEEFLQDEFEEHRVFNYKYKNNGATEFFSHDILNKDKGAL